MIGTDCPVNGSNTNVDVQGRDGRENVERSSDVAAALLRASSITSAVAAPTEERIGKAEERWRPQRERASSDGDGNRESGSYGQRSRR